MDGRKPIPADEALEILEGRLAHTKVRIRRHSESWFGRLLARFCYWMVGQPVPAPDARDGWIVCQTIGGTVWVPDCWQNCPADLRFELLLHEEAHVRQFERCGLGSRSLGIPVMGFAYFLLLPSVWTLRSAFEREGYYQSIRARAILGLGMTEGMVNHLVRVFAGRSYAWMWPFPSRVEKWAWRSAVRAEREARLGV